MVVIIDLDLQLAVQGFGSKLPAPAIQVKAQDTPTLSIYFAKGNVNYDLGTSPGLRFGVFLTGNPNPLVQYTTFTRVLDAQGRVTYVGYPNFNTTAMAAAIGSQPQLNCIGEIRYQTSFGTIARTADISFTVLRTLLSETVMDTLIAAFTTPAVNANVTARINNTNWLSAGLNISIGAGAGAYQVVSITNLTDFVAKNLGGAGNAGSGTTIPIGTSVGIAPVNVLATYPDPSIIEITTHKNVANGYAGLDGTGHVPSTLLPTSAGGFELQTNKDVASGYAGLDPTTKLKPAEFPIDNATLTFVAGLLGVPIDNHTLQIVSGKLVALPGSGDMAKSIYDVNNDGVVDHAALADNATNATSANTALTAATATKTTGAGAGVWTQDGSGNQSWQPATGGGVASLTDAETTAGVSVISSSTGVLKRLLAGTNITLTPDSPTTGAVTIAASGGGGAAPVLPSARSFEFDDFTSTIATASSISATVAPVGKLGWLAKISGAGVTIVSGVSQGHNTTDKVNGAWLFTVTNTSDSSSISLGDYTAAIKPTLAPGLGILSLEFRVYLGVLPGSTNDTIIEFGIGSGMAITAGYPNDGIVFQYAHYVLGTDNWRFVTANGGSRTPIDLGVAATTSGWHKFNLTTNAGWTSVQASIDGTAVGSPITTNLPTVTLCPYFRMSKQAGSSGVLVYLDYFFKDYQFTR